MKIREFQKLVGDVYEYVKKFPGHNRKEIARAMKKRPSDIKRALQKLEDEGRVNPKRKTT